MTTFTTVAMLENVVHGTASGNYDGSSLDFYSDPVPAANYYQGQGSLQTLTYRLQAVVAKFTIEATLNDLPEQAVWFKISEFGDAATPDTGTFTDTKTGNFVWLRTHITGFSSGNIQAVTASY